MLSKRGGVSSQTFLFYLLLILSVILFPFYESIANALLNVVSLDIYLYGRTIIGAVISILVVLIVSVLRRVSAYIKGRSEQPAILPEKFLAFLDFCRKEALVWPQVLKCSLAWCGSTAFLSAGFQSAGFIISAYAFFVFHPVWTFMLQEPTRERFKREINENLGLGDSLDEVDKRFNNFIALPIVGMCLATIAFLIGLKGFDLKRILGDAWPLAFGLCGGIAFAFTNLLTPAAKRSVKYLYSVKAGVPNKFSRYEEFVCSQHMYSSRYLAGIGGFVIVIILIPLSHLIPLGNALTGPFHVGGENSYKNLELIAKTFSIIFLSPIQLLTFSLIIVCIIAWIANYLFAEAYGYQGKEAIAASFELLSVVIALLFTLLYGTYERAVWEIIFWGGIVFQIICAASVAWMIEMKDRELQAVAERSLGLPETTVISS